MHVGFLAIWAKIERGGVGRQSLRSAWRLLGGSVHIIVVANSSDSTLRRSCPGVFEPPCYHAKQMCETQLNRLVRAFFVASLCQRPRHVSGPAVLRYLLRLLRPLASCRTGKSGGKVTHFFASRLHARLAETMQGQARRTRRGRTEKRGGRPARACWRLPPTYARSWSRTAILS